MSSRLEPLNPGYWEDPERLALQAGEQLNEGRLLVCVGAGVSRYANLPSWWGLLEAVANDSAGEPIDPNSIDWTADPYDVGQTLLERKYKGDRRAFIEALRDALYSDSTVTDFASSFMDPGMRSLSFLCQNSIRGGVSKIINYNFDNLFQMMFTHIGLVSRRLDSPHYLNSRADVDVFHPHGSLPPIGSIDDPSSIVICREDFKRDARNDWNDILVSQFCTHFPLFVGLSGYDDALLKVLGLARKRNPLITDSNWPYYGLALCYGDYNADGFEEVGIKPFELEAAEYWPDFVSQCCAEAVSELRNR